MTAKNFFSLLLISSIALTSCKKELEPQESSVSENAITATDNADAAAVTPVDAQQQTASQNNVQPQMQPAQMQQPQMQQPQPTQVAPGMNPAHGQPGHRCDISVGAPLNSPAGNTAKQVTPQQAAPASMVSPSSTQMMPSAPVATAPGMNPPHGQAGHQCSVAVGAPLPKP